MDITTQSFFICSLKQNKNIICAKKQYVYKANAYTYDSMLKKLQLWYFSVFYAAKCLRDIKCTQIIEMPKYDYIFNLCKIKIHIGKKMSVAKIICNDIN